jgi:hypothetical protein
MRGGTGAGSAAEGLRPGTATLSPLASAATSAAFALFGGVCPVAFRFLPVPVSVSKLVNCVATVPAQI